LAIAHFACGKLGYAAGNLRLSHRAGLIGTNRAVETGSDPLF
jgi:hypothetical protein